MKIINLSVGLIFILLLSDCSKKGDNNSQQAPVIYHNITQLKFNDRGEQEDSIQVINDADVYMVFGSINAFGCAPSYQASGGNYLVFGDPNTNIETDFLIDNNLSAQFGVFAKRFSEGYTITTNDTSMAWYECGGTTSNNNAVLPLYIASNSSNCNGSNTTSDFFGQDGYIVYRMKIAPSSNYYYGWCQISVASDNSSMTVYDLGTDEVANQIPVIGSY